MKDIKKLHLNSLIMALYIFQFGFLQPIAIAVKSQWPIAVFTLFLLFIVLLNNRFQVKKYVMAIFIVISIYFIFSSLILKNSTLTILPLYLEFILKSFSAFLIGSIDIEEKYLYEIFVKVALINFIALLLIPLLGVQYSIGYMRYGYAMAPSVLMFCYQIYKNKRINLIWLFLSILSFLLTLIYGSRGPLICFILFIILLFLFEYSASMRRKGILIATLGLTMFLVIKYQLLLRLLDYFYFNLNIQTYALAKFRMMIINGLAESSSGRDSIYTLILGYIKNSPFFGYGIGFSNVALGYTTHNIFLQILLESGIIGLILWIIIWGYCYFKFKYISRSNNKDIFKIITLIAALALGRLLVSSDMWLRPEYWFVLSMLINYKIKKNRTVKTLN